MKLSNVLQATKLCFAAKVTPALIGTSGVGKTSIWSQIYKELGFDSMTIIRPALIADAGDLTGLPEFHIQKIDINGKTVERKVTRFMIPEFFPADGTKTLIVIDEYNRIQKDVANSIFGLIEAEEPRIGEYKLPEGCKVVCTGNPPTDNYAGVLDFNDSAWASRLAFIKIQPELEEFVKYGKDTGNINEEMREFLKANTKYFTNGEDFEVEMFFGGDEKEQAKHITDNNRSKRKVSDLYTQAKELKISRNIMAECIRGVAGKDFTHAYLNFAEGFGKDISFADLIKDAETYKRFDYSQMAASSKVIEDMKTRLAKKALTKKETDNFMGFLQSIPLDQLQGVLKYIVDTNAQELDDKHEKALTKLADAIDSDKVIAENFDKFVIETKKETNTTEEKNEA